MDLGQAIKGSPHGMALRREHTQDGVFIIVAKPPVFEQISPSGERSRADGSDYMGKYDWAPYVGNFEVKGDNDG